MITTQYINLNMIPSGVLPILYCSQYDVGRSLGVIVYNGSEPVDLDEYTVTIEATRTDKTPITAEVITNNNIGVFVTTATMTNKHDKYAAKLVIVDGNGNRVASLTFIMCIALATMDENSEGITEDASLYQQFVAQTQSQIVAERQERILSSNLLQANINAEASARQAANNTLQSNINAEVVARTAQDAVLQAEIDQLVAPSGEAPSAAEVINARIGADGTTYDTLGNAIRGQVTDLKKALDYSDLALIGRKNLINSVAWVDNKYIKSDGTVGDNTSYHMTDKIYPTIGTEYTMLFFSNAGYYRVCAYNADDSVNSMLVNGSSQSADKRSIKFTIPVNTSYIRASFQKPGTAYGIIEGKSVDEMFSDTDVEIEQIRQRIVDIEHAVSVTWQKGLISASTGAIASSANGATSNIIEGATYVKLNETCKAVVGFYNAGTYIGKLNASGGVDTVGGSWGYITGLSDLSKIMQSYDADGITIGIVPTDSTVITTDNVQTYGYGHCMISTKSNDYDIAELSEHVSRLENVTYNQSKGAYCIMQYNVGNWYNGTGYLVPEEKYNEFYTLQKNIIERYMPDVMCMQEYRAQFTISTKSKDLLSEFYRNIVSARDNTSYDGKGIASNRNMQDVSNVAFTDTETGGIIRNYEKCYVYLNGRKVLLVSAHLGSSSIVASNINDLLSLVANEEYFIICADMNINGNNPLIAQFTTAGYHVANTGDIITYPSDTNYLAIDNIITSANIEIKSAFADTQKAGLEEGTDHYPLIAYVDIV